MASQTITGADLQYTQNNEHCYAFSGGVDLVQDTLTTIFDFTSGSGFIVGKLQSGRNVKTSAEHEHFVYLNDILIWYSKMDNATSVSNQAPNSQPLILIIPPLTKVTIKMKSLDGATTNQTIIFTGRVYEHLPVRN